MSAPSHVAAGDCERVRGRWIGQPANTLSSLAYVGVGVALVRRDPRAVRAGATLALLGVGSVAYHGPGGPTGRWLHDTSLSALSAYPLGPLGQLLSLLGAGGVIAAEDDAGLALTAGLFALGALGPGRGARAILRRPGPARRRGAACMVAGVVCHRLGRRGGAWCRPDSPWQPHAAWHLLSALGLGLLLADEIST